METKAIPSKPKASGANKRARIMVLMNPKPRFIIRRVKTHTPPLTTLFERDSERYGSIFFSIASKLTVVSQGDRFGM